MRGLIIMIALFVVKGCVTEQGRVTLDPISGPGFVLSGDQYNTLLDIPGVLDVGDRNYQYTAHIIFYPTTGEKIASGLLKRNYAPDFGAVEASPTYNSILSFMENVCRDEDRRYPRLGIKDIVLKTAKNPKGPSYILAVNCLIHGYRSLSVEDKLVFENIPGVKRPHSRALITFYPATLDPSEDKKFTPFTGPVENAPSYIALKEEIERQCNTPPYVGISEQNLLEGCSFRSRCRKQDVRGYRLSTICKVDGDAYRESRGKPAIGLSTSPEWRYTNP